MAAILDEKPQLIAPAVRAFYYRDPIDLQVIFSVFCTICTDLLIFIPHHMIVAEYYGFTVDVGVSVCPT